MCLGKQFLGNSPSVHNDRGGKFESGTMKQVLSRIIGLLVVCCSSSGALAGDVTSVPAPFGEYEVVAIRAAGNVASTTGSQNRLDWMGKSVEFGESAAVWLDGEKCATWSVREAGSPEFFLDDPNLSDVTLPPLDFGSDTVDRRLNVPVELVCNDFGEWVLANFVIIDRRVLITPTVSGETYVILEKPLSAGEIERFQAELKDMKFYHGEISGNLDSESVSSIGFYAEYRGSAYRFYRTVITENLLDRLGVLEE
jgi:hypothetical protein